MTLSHPSSKKKLLLLVPLPPPVHGSNLINQRVVECERLYRHFDVQVMALHWARSIADIGTLRTEKLVLFFHNTLRLVRMLRQFRPDLVYFVPAVTGISYYRDFLFALLVKRFPCRLVYHLHGKGIAKSARQPINRALYSIFFRNTFVIHLSEQLFADIAPVVDRSNCRFLPNGIDGESQTCVHTEDYAGADVPVIIFLSNLVLSKGPLILLEACRLLKSRGVDFKGQFVGNPSHEISEARFMTEIQNRGLENNVSYLGPMYGAEKKMALANADILAFPTRKDCFPVILLEAMANALPIVSTNEGAIPEIITEGKSGFIVDRGNQKQLSEKLEYLILNPVRAQKMGRFGYNKFMREYTLDRFYDNLLDILTALVTERPAR